MAQLMNPEDNPGPWTDDQERLQMKRDLHKAISSYLSGEGAPEWVFTFFTPEVVLKATSWDDALANHQSKKDRDTDYADRLEYLKEFFWAYID